ncbi:MAG: hypothetical protein HXX80_02210 [Nitrososphaerales archaeon]|nr:hypothetical protein [Nitrososphaerales archaeon]
MLFEEAKDHLLDWSYADYFYIISYPTYSGYRIEHDPTYTVYLTIPSVTAPNPLVGLFILIVIATGTVVAVLLSRRGRKKTRINLPMPP